MHSLGFHIPPYVALLPPEDALIPPPDRASASTSARPRPQFLLSATPPPAPPLAPAPLPRLGQVPPGGASSGSGRRTRAHQGLELVRRGGSGAALALVLNGGRRVSDLLERLTPTPPSCTQAIEILRAGQRIKVGPVSGAVPVAGAPSPRLGARAATGTATGTG